MTNKLKKKTQNSKRMTDDYDYLTNAASATEFTGLIPSLPQNDTELEAYNDICRFLPPSASDQKNLSDQTD